MALAGEFNSKSIPAAVGATIGFLVGPTAVVSVPIGLFMLPVTQEFGIGRGLFAVFMACAATLAAVISPVTGRIMDRYGVRWVAIFGVVLLGCAELLLSQARGSMWVLFAFNLAVGVAAGIQNPVAYSKLISMWFHRHRGMVLSLAGGIGAAGGAAIVPQIVGPMIAAHGWRAGYISVGVFVLAIGIPLLLLLLHEPKAAAGQSRRQQMAASAALPGLTRAEAVRKPAYLLVMGSLFLAVGALVATSINGPALLASRGLNIGPLFLTMMALGSMTGQLSSAFLLDRVNSPKVGIPYVLLAFLGAVGLVNFGHTTGTVLASTFLMGVGQGAEIGLAAYYVSRYCGLKAYGELFGVVYGVVVAGAGLGPVLVGFLFDVFGNGPLWLAIEIALFLSVVGVALLPRYAFDAHRGPGELVEKAVDAGDAVPAP